MNKRQNKWPFKLLVGLVLILLGIYALALYTDRMILFQASKIAAIPIVLTLYFSRLKYMANIFFTIFLLFFLGSVLSTATSDIIAVVLSKTMFLASYSLLMFVLISRMKRVKFEGMVSLYLIFVCLLNTYFFYLFYDAIKENFVSTVDATFYIIRSALLIAMCFLAFTVYLSNETKQTILFLTMSICFVFSDVLQYITDLYIYYWLFDWMGNALQLVGFFVLFAYVTNHNRKSNPIKLHQQVSQLEALSLNKGLQSEVTQ